jgi:hypothetical protein
MLDYNNGKIYTIRRNQILLKFMLVALVKPYVQDFQNTNMIGNAKNQCHYILIFKILMIGI